MRLGARGMTVNKNPLHQEAKAEAEAEAEVEVEVEVRAEDEV